MRPRPPGWPGASASARIRSRRRRWRPAWGPRSWSPRCPTCSGCGSPQRTRSCTPPCPTRRTPWEQSSRGAAPSPSRPRPDDWVAWTWTPSMPGTPPAPWCSGPTRRRTRPAASVTSVPRPRGGGRTASPSSPTSATPSSPGTAHRAPCCSTASTAWWPCTRCPSARTWPACASASTPATPSWSSSFGPCASTPASWSRAPLRPPASRPSATTSTWSSSGGATGSGWAIWPGSSSRTGAPSSCPRAASTCGSRSRCSAGPTRGRWPRRWPPTAGCWSARVTSTGRPRARHVRVAVVQPMERLALVGERLGASTG